MRILWNACAAILLCLAGNAFAAGAPAAGPTGRDARPAVLVLGDSLSAEYGIARGTGWVALLQQTLDKNGFDYSVVNASISGETTSGGRARLAALLARHHPAIAVIELGSNDALRGIALTLTEQNLRAMIHAVRQTGCKVVLVGMHIPPNYGPDYAENFYTMYRKVATAEHTAYVPFLLAGIAGQPALFQADQLHPVAAAQPRLLDNVWPVLRPLLSSRPRQTAQGMHRNN